MFAKLLNFEVKLHTRQVGFWIALAALTLFAVLVASSDFISVSIEGGDKVKNNGAIPLALNTTIFSLLSIFFAAVFVVTGVMRDDTHKSMEIIHSTPLKTPSMIISRMVGVWIATTLCVIAASVGMVLGEFMPWADKDTFGPLNPLYYVHPILVFVLINSLIVTAIYTFIAVTTRNKTLVYVSAVGVFVLYNVAGILSQDAPEWISSLIDPFGSTALANVVEFWPAAEQNATLTPIMGYVGMNRLAWLVISVVLLGASFLLSTRGIVLRKTKTKQDKYVPTGRIDLAPVTPSLGGIYDFKSFLRRFRYEYITTVRSTAFMILIGIALSLFGLVLYVQMFLSPDRILPTSQLIANLTLGSLTIPMIIVMVFFGGEIMWRDRVAGMHKILDATPVKDWTLLAAKWLALIAVVFSVIVIGLLFGMIAQSGLSGGEIPIVGSTYFKIGLLSFGVGFIFQTLLVMFVQNFAPNRIVGMLGAAALLIFIAFFLGRLPFFHPLMGYGRVSPGGLSEMAGFSGMMSFGWFTLYWSFLALLLAVVSVWLWRRGLQTGLFTGLYLAFGAFVLFVLGGALIFSGLTDSAGLNLVYTIIGGLMVGLGCVASVFAIKFNLVEGLRNLKAKISPVTGSLAALTIAGFIGTGFHIYKSYSIDADYLNAKQRELRSVEYEKLVKPIIDLEEPQPRIVAVEADVDFYPSNRDAIVRGSYDLVNQTDKPITRLFVNEPTSNTEDVRQLNLTGARIVKETELAKNMREYDVRLFEIDPPLMPGEMATMTFETYYHPPRLGDGSAIRSNGTFVNNFATMPQIGLQANFLSNPDKRRKYDLPEKELAAERADMEARQNHFISQTSDYVDFKARICTDKGQIPIAPGQFKGESVEGDRVCRNYEAINPILNFFSFLSADYAIKETVWQKSDHPPVDLRIFYHPKHDFNVDLMMEAMKTSFDVYTETYGPYQFAQLRIMEFPYSAFAQAFAGTVPFSENIGFVQDPGSPEDNTSIDFASYVTMHEIGHQWFAHQIVPANTKGYNVLSEGMTENATMLAYERAFGYQKARRMLEKRAIEQYLANRAFDRDDEPPLARAENQQYIIYNKAAWAFWGLNKYAGEQQVQGAVRQFVEDFGLKGPPYPTTLQLVDYLKQGVGPDFEQLVDDYFERITFWDLRFGEGDIQVTPVNDGYKVTIPLNIDKKIASEEDGKETSVTEIDGETLNEWVEIGFYTTDPKDKLGDEWMALERLRVTEKESTVSFIVPEKPTHILLDPRRLLIERNVEDNMKEPDTKLASAK